ncbi:hypothetical protein D3C74_49820 [compost metagenome]
MEDWKRVKKANLRDFFEKQKEARIQEINDKRNREIESVLGPALDEYLKSINGQEIDNLAGKLVDALNKIIYVSVNNFPRYITNTVSKVNNDLVTFQSDLKMHMLTKAKSRLFEPSGSLEMYAFEALSEKVAHAYQQCVDFALSLESEKDKIRKLCREINGVINAARDGKKAYTDLVALGVDLSDLPLPSAMPTLPAIVKLSVPPCLLKGDCKEPETQGGD